MNKETPRIYIDHEKINILNDAILGMKKVIRKQCDHCKDNRDIAIAWLRLLSIIDRIVQVK